MNEISNKTYVIKMSDGTLIYISQEQADNLKQILQSENKTFIDVEGQAISTRYINGIFTAEVIDSEIRRKNGQWKCEYGTWHDKGQQCGCGIAKQYGL